MNKWYRMLSVEISSLNQTEWSTLKYHSISISPLGAVSPWREDPVCVAISGKAHATCLEGGHWNDGRLSHLAFNLPSWRRIPEVRESQLDGLDKALYQLYPVLSKSVNMR